MSIFDPTYKTIEIDTKLKELVLNRLTKDQFDQLSAHSPDELWFIQDSELSGQPIVVDTRQVEIPTKLSEFQNDVGYLSAVSWSQVTGKPTIPSKTSQLTNDSGFITSAYVQTKIDAWRDWEYSETQPGLKFTANTAGSTIAMRSYGSTPSVSLEYSTDNGSSWNAFTVGSTTITLSEIGDYVLFRAGSGGNTSFGTSQSNYNQFQMTGSLDVEGSIMYLLDKNGSEDAVMGEYCFEKLLADNNVIRSAENLELPSSTLSESCYRDFISRCTSLTTPPKVLPATTCVSNCYLGMFYGCSSLEKSPHIKATTLANNCLYMAFYNCSNLGEIKLDYTGNFSSSYMNSWVYGVSSSGTFYYNGSDTNRGTSAIPNNWTIQQFA